MTLPRAEAAARIEKLREEVRHHDYLYYVEDRAELSDDDYDALFSELKRLEHEHPELVTPDSPTQRVGGIPRPEFPTVEHTAPMLSLDSTREEAELRRFDERMRKAAGGPVRYVLEPKLDGASVELVYEHGVLARAATRGDGVRGEGVTENVKTIRSVPLRLNARVRPVPALLAVRGEALMTLKTFAAVNRRLLELGQEPKANPRNFAAGSLRQLDARMTAERPLELFAYDILHVEGVAFARDTDALQALRDWGLRLPPRWGTADSADEVLGYHARWGAERDQLDFEIDGIVVKLDDFDLRTTLGTTSHHPRWAVALKFPPRPAVTRVVRVFVSVGRTGRITPVAELEPVQVGGVTVVMAGLHNREEVKRKDIRDRDRVRVQRAGDVIPEVVERIEEEGHERPPPFKMPPGCPSCGTELVEIGPYTQCPNRFGCGAQLEGRILHFGSGDAADITGLGDGTVRKLLEAGYVRDLADLYRLTTEQAQSLEGYAEKSAQKLVDAIQGRRKLELARFLYGLGIPEVGVSSARDLAEHFGALEAVRRGPREQLLEVAGIGPKMSEAIAGFFADERHQRAIDELLTAGVEVPETTKKSRSGALLGQKFVFTGTLVGFSRAQAQKLVEQLGAKVTSSVSKSTSCVVVGADAGSKAEEAQRLKVRVLDEAGFVELLREHGVAP